ncbi:iron ABC transporter substrate-binding protein [Rhodococcus sp. RS1C4]|uniref:iron-siderophore ABC transporter substrate-binding protein n=1 Tax=Nocardiaceae TaxID=85025 RepID=UPI00037766DF|nr:MULTISPECIES: iron-siderophore ABC transporter substrate-binding protein [Rhodococcus]OZC51785.1 iron ABC transporter substrate-binding protein [Rhodococcus sp. RS1C4]OZD15331.1 iron ABC transporter substrate-binding protein [Rhodococcus sp. 06-156-4C]OZD19580.1 iron ABC transporter substrate-binding protein [Rhodococcus sp. 06-156-4a]OZD23107.1 iron ABC transporter substrate-binding protein [Rhodococcus sp. 06-156-3C]OZD25599.1 iron ABC transporter substrate-binding protein [Rhodococcus sp
MRTSRLALLAPAIAAVAALTMTACSSSDSSDTDAEGATVSTIFGDVTVPENPQRVVALGWSDAETALALGVQPVGASDWLAVGGDGLGPWVEESYDTPPTILGTYEVDIESVAALDPDLILWTRSTNDQATYDQLSELAPTVGAPAGTEIAYGTTWDGQTELVAEALGKEAEGRTLIDETNAAFDAATSANPEFDGKNVVVGTLYSGQLGAYVDGDTRVEFMKRLGFVNKPEIQAQASDGKFAIDLSAENAAQLDADLTVMFPIGETADAIANDPSIQGLPVARDGRLVVLGDLDLSNAFSAASVAGTRYALENAVPLFAAPLKG